MPNADNQLGTAAATVFTVTVTFIENGVTATQSIVWTVKPVSSKRGKD